ncbi:InlB B-repeat-containing protein, partial [Nocardioides fonticola]|uniref:InlB B-repeat-containing protein n=1 Tax=Nocardioides fonticola TaxID=450363 RepID=UPI0031E359E3
MVLAVAWGVSPTQPVVAATVPATTFASLQQTTSTCTGATTVVLSNDVSGSGTLSINCDLTLDLSGHNLGADLITVGTGLSFTLTDATTSGAAGTATLARGIRADGASITLTGRSHVKATGTDGYPAIGALSTTPAVAITVEGDAVVDADGTQNGQGIGGGPITIQGHSVVDATSAGSGAAIGAARAAFSPAITIGGDATVTATGGLLAAGIGSGWNPSLWTGPVVIKDRAVVTAVGGVGAAGIGTGRSGFFGGTIVIGAGTTVTATAGSSSSGDFPAAIGGGANTSYSTNGSTTIAGTVTAISEYSAVGMGTFSGDPQLGSGAITIKTGGVLRVPAANIVFPNGYGSQLVVEKGGLITGSGGPSPTYGGIVGNGVVQNDGVIDLPTAKVLAPVAGHDYRLDLNANGGSVSPSSVTVFADTLANGNRTLPTPTRPGYALTGWNTQADGSGTTVDRSTDLTQLLPDSTGAPTSRTLYAQWSLMTSVTTFDDLAVVADSCTSPTTVRLDASFNATGRLFVDCDLTIDIAGRSVLLGGITVRSGTLTITDTTPNGQQNGLLNLGGVALPGTDLVITGRAHVISDAPFGQNGAGLGNIANEPGASITIDGAATVAATSRGTGPAIGGASVTIRGSAVVNATSTGTGAAIGGGDGQATAPITIGGTARVTAMGSFGGTGGAAIGTGRDGTWAGDVTISDNANVDATGGTGAAAIGGGKNVGGGVVRIGTGTTVYAVGLGPVAGSRSTGATIGAGADADGGTVTIAGTVTLQSFYTALGVGLGPDGVASRRFGTVTIATGGRVNGPAPLFVTESDPNGPELIIEKGGFVAVTRSILGGTTTGQILNDGAISLGSASVSVPVQHRNYRFSLVLDAGQAPFLTTLVLADTVSAASAFLPEPFARAGFAFGGWNTKADGSGATISKTTDLTTILPDAPGAPTEQTLYAIWLPLTSVSTAADLAGVLRGCSDTEPPLRITVAAPITAKSSEMVVNCNVVLDLHGNDVAVRNVVIGAGKTFEVTDSTPVSSQVVAGTFTADGSNSSTFFAGIRTTGATFRVSGTAKVVARGTDGSGFRGAGIGGDFQGAGGSVVISDYSVVSAFGGRGAAGIGAGSYARSGGEVTIQGHAVVDAHGLGGAAGIGGGFADVGVDAPSVTLTVRGDSRVTAVGDGGAGIGAGYFGSGGTVTIGDRAVAVATGVVGVGGVSLGAESGGSVTVAGTLVASGTFSALGTHSGELFGSVVVKSGGVLRLPSGPLVIPDSNSSGPEITVEPGGLITGSDAPLPTYATISGAGQIQNGGRILMPALNVGVPVTKRNYAISFDLDGAAGSQPSSTTVFADTVTNGGRDFPADPVRPGFTFAGWNTKANGTGTTVTGATDLTAVLADAAGAATSQTLYAQWRVLSSVGTFDDLAGVLGGCSATDPPLTVTVTAPISAASSELSVNCNAVLDLHGNDVKVRNVVIGAGKTFEITDSTPVSSQGVAGTFTADASIVTNLAAAAIQTTAATFRASGTASVVARGALGPNDTGAGIGGGFRGAGGTVVIGDHAVVSAFGGNGAAGIGAGGSARSGGTVTIEGDAVVDARGARLGAGIGGGSADSGFLVPSVTLVVRDRARLTAIGASAAGIGAGVYGNGGSVVIADQAVVAASGLVGVGGIDVNDIPDTSGGSLTVSGTLVASGTASALGTNRQSGVLFGSVVVKSGGVLRLPSGPLVIPDSNSSGPEITVESGGLITGSDAPLPTYATISGAGQIQNSGRILMPAVNVGVPVTKRNYAISFDLNGAAGSPPSSTTVFADTVVNGGRDFPADPVRPGFTFAGWNTKANGTGTTVTGATDLTTVLADAAGAATSQTLYAKWQIKSSATTVEDLIGIAGGCTSATTLTLPVDMTTTARLFVSCDLTIDLAGHSLSVGAVTVPTNARLRITDSTVDKAAAGLFTVAHGLQVAGGSVTIDGTARVRATGDGSLPAIGPGPGSNGSVLIGGDATVVATGDGTAGNSNAGIGGAVTIKDRAEVTATGSVGAAGIGSRKETNQTQAILIQGSAVVTATGGAGAAGIGSGEAGNAGTITIGAGTTVTATGTGVQFPGPAGIGGGAYGAGGVVTISGTVTASAPFSAVGGGSSDNGVAATGFGLVTIRSGGVLRVPSGEVRIPDTFSGASEFVVDAGGLVAGSVPDTNGASTYATIRGGSATTGQISNSGVITLPSANVLVPVTRRNYALSFDLNGAAGTAPGSVTVFADTVTNGGRVFPTSPSRPGFTFAGWNTKADGTGSTVTASTDLTQLLANAPGTATAQTLYAQWTPLSSVSTVADLVGLLAGCTAVDPPLPVTVTADLDLSSSELVSNCNIVLDLNGHSVSVRDVVLKPGTTLEVTDSSTAPTPPGVLTVDASGTSGLPGITNGGADLVVSGRATVSVVGGAGASAIGDPTNGLGTVTVKDGATLRLPSGQLVVPDSNSGSKPEIVVEKGGVISGSGGASPTYASIVGPGGGAPSGSISNA